MLPENVRGEWKVKLNYRYRNTDAETQIQKYRCRHKEIQTSKCSSLLYIRDALS